MPFSCSGFLPLRVSGSYKYGWILRAAGTKGLESAAKPLAAQPKPNGYPMPYSKLTKTIKTNYVVHMGEENADSYPLQSAAWFKPAHLHGRLEIVRCTVLVPPSVK